MRRLLALSGCMLFLGCGSGEVDLTVNGLTLIQKDQLYTSKPSGFFCDTVPEGQIRIVVTDFSPGCPLDVAPGDPSPRDSSLEHNEIVIVLGGLGMDHSHQDLRTPFSVSKIDCVTAGDNGTAYFNHYKAGSSSTTTPDTTIQVDSGSVKLDQWDASGKLDTKGSFTLTFGGSTVTGKLGAVSCDPTG